MVSSTVVTFIRRGGREGEARGGHRAVLETGGIGGGSPPELGGAGGGRGAGPGGGSGGTPRNLPQFLSGLSGKY